MDKNKEHLLWDVGYIIRRTCFNCRNAHLSPSGWGTCTIHFYRHEKHTGPPRLMSIHETGYCPKHELRHTVLGAFKQFFEH